MLTIEIGEHHAILGDAVNVRCRIAHQAVAVLADVGDAYIVTHDDEDVRQVGSVSLRRNGHQQGSSEAG